jgi:hypothetical protein
MLRRLSIVDPEAPEDVAPILPPTWRISTLRSSRVASRSAIVVGLTDPKWQSGDK